MKSIIPEIRLGVYRNYKGHDYEVMGVGTNTETREIFVVYKMLYDTEDYKNGSIWIRPLDMFNGKVTINGKERQRFKYIGVGKADK